MKNIFLLLLLVFAVFFTSFQGFAMSANPLTSSQEYDYVMGWVHSKNTNKSGQYEHGGRIIILEDCYLFAEPTTESKALKALSSGDRARVFAINMKENYIPISVSHGALRWTENPQVNNIWFKLKVPIEKQPTTYKGQVDKAKEDYLRIEDE